MTQKFLRDDGSFQPIASTGSSASGPITLLTNSTTANITLGTTGTYSDGPSVAQGTSGTWFASGSITIATSAASNTAAKLWDGTTVISAAVFKTESAPSRASMALSGIITSPAGNLRISAAKGNAVTTTILSSLDVVDNAANSSTITVIRIG